MKNLYLINLAKSHLFDAQNNIAFDNRLYSHKLEVQKCIFYKFPCHLHSTRV